MPLVHDSCKPVGPGDPLSRACYCRGTGPDGRQEDFHSADEASTYHLGVMQVIREQFKSEPDEIHTEYVGRPWRRFRRTVEAMDDAEEAED